MDFDDAQRWLRPSADEAFAAWRSLVDANYEQIERLREDHEEAPADFYAPRARAFRPGGPPPPEVPALLELLRPSDSLLDIGAGGGRYAVPLAARVREVLAVEPSSSMRWTLQDAARHAGASNVRLYPSRWPAAHPLGIPSVDATFVAHVLYDVPDLRTFLEATEAHTRRLCAVVLGDMAPSRGIEAVWAELHGEPAHVLPALPEFLTVLAGWGRRFDVRTFPLPAPPRVTLDEAVASQRSRFWLREGSPKDERLRALLAEHFGSPDGLVRLPPRLRYTALVTWRPR